MQQLLYLKGNYPAGFTHVGLDKNKHTTSNIVLICIHGLYGEAGDPRSKSVQLASALQEIVRGVVYISTSRDWRLYTEATDRAAAFQEKTFAQEQADVQDAITAVCKESEELFGVPSNDLRLWVVANSMGGTLTTISAATFPAIEKMVVCGSGISPSSRNLPILSSYPSKHQVRAAAALFKGKLLHLSGSHDTTVLPQVQHEFFAAFTNATKEFVTIEGANHNFSSLFGAHKRQAYNRYVQAISSFLRRA